MFILQQNKNGSNKKPRCNKARFLLNTLKKTPSSGGSLIIFYWSFCGREWGGGGRLSEAGRLLTFSAFRMGAYLRWALIRGWVLIRINTVNDTCNLLTVDNGFVSFIGQ